MLEALSAPSSGARSGASLFPNLPLRGILPARRRINLGLLVMSQASGTNSCHRAYRHPPCCHPLARTD
jgi:hypothetical protein